MLISVHIPKCAGTSFHRVLRAVYGDQLWLNYGQAFTRDQLRRTDSQTHRPTVIPPDTACIHGHFIADTFRDHFPNARLITWLRDPVERVVSNYHHYLRAPDLRDDCCRRLIEEKLTLLQFAELDWMRNLMTRYLGGLPLEAFEAIGISEDFDHSLRLIARSLNWPSPAPLLPAANLNPQRIKARYELTPADRARLRDLNSADQALYSEAVSRVSHTVYRTRAA